MHLYITAKINKINFSTETKKKLEKQQKVGIIV